MADDEDIAALVVDNGSGMCKGESVCEMIDLVFVHRSKMTTRQERRRDFDNDDGESLFTKGKESRRDGSSMMTTAVGSNAVCRIFGTGQRRHLCHIAVDTGRRSVTHSRCGNSPLYLSLSIISPQQNLTLFFAVCFENLFDNSWIRRR